MKNREIQVTAEQLDDLMAHFAAMPSEPIGKHLSDQELAAYTMDMLDAAEMTLLSAHLDSCLECATEVEYLLDASLALQDEEELVRINSMAWQGQEGEQRLAALREKVLGVLIPEPEQPEWWERLAIELRQLIMPPIFTLQGARADSRPSSWDIQTKSGIVALYIEEDEGKNLFLSIDSEELQLEGQKLRVRIGSWQCEIVLRRVAPDQVGEEIEITQAERKQFPADPMVTIELVE